MNRETKIIRNMYILIYLIFLFLYVIALFTISFDDELYSDSSTAYYWFSEIIKTANVILNIGLVSYPVILLTVLKRK